MPQIDRRVSRYTDIKQDICEFALPYPRRLVNRAANKNQRKRQHTLNKQRGQKAVKNRAHHWVRLIEPPSVEQRLGAYPIDEVEKV